MQHHTYHKMGLFFEGADLEALAERGRALALIPNIQARKRRIGDLAQEEAIFLRAKKEITREMEADFPAAAWFRDNYYILEKTLRELDIAYYDIVLAPAPVMERGEYAGRTRISALAESLTELSQGNVSHEKITVFLEAYQELKPLSVRELLAFVEYVKAAILRLLATAVEYMQDMIQTRQEAAEAAQKISGGSALSAALDREQQENSALLEMLWERLGREREKEGVREEILSLLAMHDTTVEEAVRAEHIKRMQLKNIMRDSVNSLKNLATLDRRQLVTGLSRTFAILMEDDVFAHMDDPSRDYYIMQVERLAKKWKIKENVVARRAVRLAGESGKDLSWYILGDGAGELAASFHLSYKRKKTEDLLLLTHYILPALAAVLTGWLCDRTVALGIGIALLSFIPYKYILGSYFSRLLLKHNPPRMIPRIRVDEIPDEARTLVVVPTLLTDQKDTLAQLARLEEYSLANRGDNLLFALFGDMPDGENPDPPGGEEIRRAALLEVERLNRIYGEKFFFFERKPIKNRAGRYAGKERKRGALLALCSLLLGEAEEEYAAISGVPQGIRYVITLDADTQLNPGAAKKLIGGMLHPANRPQVDEERGIVTRGHALLLPMVDVDIVAARQTPYTEIFAGRAGMDSYSAPVSELYQDLFDEATYTGKGIFDLEIYNRLLKGRFPAETVLSHDLLEGGYLRAGLMSDVRVEDGLPKTVLSAGKRDHRWTRGDWQTTPWLRRRVRNETGKSVSNPLGFLTKFKIWENLFRSLVPILSLLLIPFGFWAGGYICLIAEILALLPWFFEPISNFNRGINELLKNVGKGATLRDAWMEGKTTLLQGVINFCLLPYSCALRADAICRALWRMHVSHKNMLEWTTADQAERRDAGRLSAYYRAMWFAPVFGVFQVMFDAFCGFNFFFYSLAIGILFLAAPFLAYFLSLPLEERQTRLRREEEEFLGDAACRIWRFFDETADRRTMISPDNVQFAPPRPPAQRTSPTNVAYSLIAGICAYDCGYIGKKTLLERTEKITAALERMEKWHGHMLNWVKLPSLEPLEPKYVSSVDSGNLACYLLAAQGGLRRIAGETPDYRRRMQAFRETIGMCMEKAKQEDDDGVCRLAETYLGRDKIDAGDFTEFLEQLRAKSMPRLMDKCFQPFWRMLERMEAEEEGDGDTADSAEALCQRLQALFDAMDFAPLYNPASKLFHIGISLPEEQLSENYYDLFASEIRQASFIAIAKGDVPAEHWFAMARPLINLGTLRALISWSGTMFEYFMPALLMPAYPGTLLGETAQGVVAAQKSFAKKLPFGISESGYYAFDRDLYYQYKAFGVPKLGLSSSLGQKVIAPYATFLMMRAAPEDAIRNLERLRGEGAYGKYGFYEAVDYTDRGGPGGKVVRSFMAHHQGMSLVALANFRMQDRIRRDFYASSAVRAFDILLKEKIPPRNIVIRNVSPEEKTSRKKPRRQEEYRETFNPLTDPWNNRLLSNGQYLLRADAMGRCLGSIGETCMTREGISFKIREGDRVIDACCDGEGGFLATFQVGKVQYEKRVEGFCLTREVCVHPSLPMEVHSLRIQNTSEEEKRITIAASAVPLLCPERDYISHPAFSELFIDTKLGEGMAVARRRGRYDEIPEKYLAIYPVCGDEPMEFETDRAEFMRHPFVMNGGDGGVIHPILACQTSIVLAPGEKREFHLHLGYGEDREALAAELRRFAGEDARRLAFEMAETLDQAHLQYVGISFRTALLYEKLAARVLHSGNWKEKQAEAIRRAGNRQELYALGISGEKPLLVLELPNREEEAALKEYKRVAEYWRVRGLDADIVALLGKNPGYLQENIEGIRILTKNTCAPVLVDTLLAAAGMVIFTGKSLKRQMHIAPQIYPARRVQPSPMGNQAPAPGELQFPNGFGGFSPDGRSYVMTIDADNPLPRPWSNILTNGRFGSVVTAGGWSYTWMKNSRMFRLTPFAPDPTWEKASEWVCLADPVTGEYCFPMPSEWSRDSYSVRFSFGKAEFDTAGEISTHAEVYVPKEEDAKVTRLTIRNTGGGRRLKIYYGIRPILSEQNEAERRGIVTEWRDGALCAHSPLNPWIPGCAYAAIPGYRTHGTGDAGEALGIFGQELPAGIWAAELSGKTGAGMDPYLLLSTEFYIPAGRSLEIPLVFGWSESGAAGADARRAADAPPPDTYQRLTEKIQVQTPSSSFDTLVNGWLLYQTAASRVDAKTGYFQSGGATGFRDQLQDMLAFLLIEPERVREHILLCASRQFAEGDVLHWWHPEAIGVRTHMSDDLLFLAFLTLQYIRVTGDDAILFEKAHYLASVEIPEGQHDLYQSFSASPLCEPLLEHILRAVDHAAAFGSHGLPLMKGGDWNDGMDRVGAEGKGESVWLGFFLYYILDQLIPLLQKEKRERKAAEYKEIKEALQDALEENAWDGEWYLRAFFDDGTPLGSASGEECKIDLISQAWAVISGAASPERARQAMENALLRLKKEKEGVLLLLHPAFDKTEKDPGYIKGYTPGVRENGGQYTHGAAWGVIAACLLNKKSEAFELFEMLNPINHTRSKTQALTYKGEPYAVAADVYYTERDPGRAGWTWYTGSSAYLLHAALTYILGMKKWGRYLSFAPCVPEEWEGFSLTYTFGASRYHITLQRGGQASPPIELRDDGVDHEIFYTFA